MNNVKSFRLILFLLYKLNLFLLYKINLLPYLYKYLQHSTKETPH
nr:MAG TPA: hypothetical protein [Inoviridae sp.]